MECLSEKSNILPRLNLKEVEFHVVTVFIFSLKFLFKGFNKF